MPDTSPRAVYTALFGGYERLVEQPLATSTDIPFICLTDDPGITSETWEVRVVEPALACDPARSSRYPKILGDPLATQFDETLWIDNRVLLEEDPGVVLDQMLGNADIGVLQHSFRETVVAEFDEVARLGLDEPARIYEQLIHYAETKPHILDEPPFWGAIIARRWTPEVRGAMRVWMDHVLRYSRRDQLSFRYALDELDRVEAFPLDNVRSPWHTWITDVATIDRKATMRANAFRTSIRAPLAAAAEAGAEVASLRTRLEAETRRADQAETAAADLRARLGRLRTRVAVLREKLRTERARSAALGEELARSPVRRARRAAGTTMRTLRGRRLP
ncbi:MAG TPA: glycosyltransferase domain-containing protein [Marmoricola sp.]|nr:glycosyltransferase domain-containing protein [Marmoricola sp.]